MRILWRNNFTFLLLLLTILLIPWAQVKLFVFGLPLYLPEVGIALALIGALFEKFFPSDKKVVVFSLPDRIFVIGIVLFLFGAVSSFAANPFSLTGLGMLKSWFFFPALFGYLLWRETRTFQKRQLALALWLLMLLGVVVRSLFLALSQVFTYDGRLAGDYSSPNFLAFLVAPVILLTGYFFFSLRGSKHRSQYGFILGGVFMLSLGVLSLTHSYGAWLGVAGALGVFFFVERPFRIYHSQWLPFVLLVLLVAGIFLSLEGQSSKWHTLITGENRSSLSSRVMIWRSATQILSDHPVFGIGLGRFQAVYLEYQKFFPPYLEWAVPEPHNILLAVVLSTGMLGLLGFLLFLGRLFLLLGRRFLSAGGLYNGFLLSLLTLFLLSGLFDTPLFKNDLALQFFLLLAIALPHTERKNEPSPKETTHRV